MLKDNYRLCFWYLRIVLAVVSPETWKKLIISSSKQKEMTPVRNMPALLLIQLMLIPSMTSLLLLIFLPSLMFLISLIPVMLLLLLLSLMLLWRTLHAVYAWYKVIYLKYIIFCKKWSSIIRLLFQHNSKYIVISLGTYLVGCLDCTPEDLSICLIKYICWSILSYFCVLPFRSPTL